MALSGAGWEARRGAERGAEQILREIGPFTARLSALQRGHTPRGFPSGTVGSGCLLFRCHAGLPGSCPAHGFPSPAGARRSEGAFSGLGFHSGTPGPGCQPSPGFLARTEMPFSRRRCAEAAGCAFRTHT